VEIMLTLTMTTCKRLDLFKKTIESFVKCCLDICLVDKIFIVDDNSGDEDISQMILWMAQYEVLRNVDKAIFKKDEKNKGHPQSMNIIYDQVDSDWILHLEDDWLFTRPDNFISKSLAIMENDKSIKQVLLRTTDIMAINQNVSTCISDDKPIGFDYIKYEYTGCHNRDSKGGSAWCGWNLNPAVCNFKEIKKLGKFPIGEPCFEYNYSRKFWQAGYKVAYFPENYCEHLGADNSAYKLNGTNK
jgi:hypothetical protein